MFKRCFLIGIFTVIGFSSDAFSESFTYQRPRFILHIQADSNNPSNKLFKPSELADESFKVLDETYEHLSEIFAADIDKQVVLRFLSPEAFKKHTGAPAWTSAMFYQGEISVPLSKHQTIGSSELNRALKHEYVHAFMAELSDYRCPAWLDEGIAQILEGDPNPILGPALRKLIANREAIPLSSLRDGFTTMDSEHVPAAYAQSLFVARKIVQKWGFKPIKDYLVSLKEGSSEAEAFEFAFGESQKNFEGKLTSQIRLWAASSRRQP